VQREGVLLAQPARLDDAAAARVEALQRAFEAGGEPSDDLTILAVRRRAADG